ncbi:hypothetical protein GUITHDRAFT_111206 [Guillardia theta CCMP2712]|uniref:Tail specific protease domain-containing protein n=1 Tax=Guillardia theta (strain CCMP2712) TaxID=905079 RepID=L1J3Z2_GUITC|nr:hypothetical protein GUITHDRAFT_111206 [Guillardia theta CCMP2712]EKX42839.1 hypothetical protein GUITHDRAFT_111206 [Guillardia theta CCMP2712]|eukprot:XP_005829819.1 hypothetical protein GUITHDRAFT_111206 [Guillardia theta CCMP2712]
MRGAAQRRLSRSIFVVRVQSTCLYRLLLIPRAGGAMLGLIALVQVLVGHARIVMWGFLRAMSALRVHMLLVFLLLFSLHSTSSRSCELLRADGPGVRNVEERRVGDIAFAFSDRPLWNGKWEPSKKLEEGMGGGDEGEGGVQLTAYHSLALEAWDLVRKEFIDQNALNQASDSRNVKGSDLCMQRLDSPELNKLFGASKNQVVTWDEIPRLIRGRKIETRDECYGLIDTMVSSLPDKYTRFYRPSQLTELIQVIDPNGEDEEEGDVGLSLQRGFVASLFISDDDGLPCSRIRFSPSLWIRRVRPNGPADAAGLKRGDRHQPPSSVIELTRSKMPSEEAAWGMRMACSIKQDGIVRNKDVGLFLTSLKLEEAVTRLHREGGIDLYMLDLRGNMGGLLRSGISLCESVLPNGEILVDEGTASSSELVAAALRDSGRAILVGTTTFGKGTIQAIPDLLAIVRLSDRSGVQLTIAKFDSPKHCGIAGSGLIPDIFVEHLNEEEEVSKLDLLCHSHANYRLCNKLGISCVEVGMHVEFEIK